MQTVSQERTLVSNRETIHPLTAEDAAVMTAMRAMVEPHKGLMQGVAARAPYDAIMGRVGAPAAVSYEADTVGGVPGWWCRPEGADSNVAILHLHGGWFNWGSAQAFRHFIGHMAKRVGAAAFVPDYRLAPEHAFPAARNDVLDCYRGLVERGTLRVAVTGDSAGGALALSLASAVTSPVRAALVAVAVLSPVTDLSLSGASWESRALVDPYFTKSQIAQLVQSYLGDHDATEPAVSPLWSDLKGLPPLRIHVGDAEVLLDDSRRLFNQAAACGVDARLDVWEGMAHGFASATGRLAAADKALDAIGVFLRDRLAVAALV